MKTLEERAKLAQIKMPKTSSPYVMFREGYIQGATEQKAVDDKECETMVGAAVREIQDNVSKARELQLDYISNGCGDSTDIRCACEEMAEWKDHQFKEYLEKKKLACVMNAKQVFGYDMGGAYDWKLKAHFCDEILNELFPNDNAHN